MNTIPQTGRWNEISSILNDNFAKIGLKLDYVSDVTLYNKGRYTTAQSLVSAHPTPLEGSFAYIGTSAPYSIFLYSKSNGWQDSGEKGEYKEYPWDELPSASPTSTGLMSAMYAQQVESNTQKVNEVNQKINKYAPTSIVVMTEAELQEKADRGELEEGVLYLGTEDEE